MAKTKKRAGGLTKRYDQSYKTRDRGGARKGVYNYKEAGVDVSFFKVKEGKIRLDILPFVIKSKKHPLVASGDMEIGDLDYVSDVWIHRNVGPTEADVVCLKLNYGRPCPICEAADKLRKAGEEEEYKSLRASRRVAYNVIDVRNPDKGVQVFETSHFLFEKELIEEAREATDDGDIVNFADIEDGLTVVCRASQDSIGKTEFFKYKSFTFVEREEEYDEDILEETVSFDEILTVLSYEEAELLLVGGSELDEEEEKDNPPPKRRKRKAPVDDDDDDEDEEEEEAPRKSRRKKSVKEDDDDDGDDGGDDDDDERPRRSSSSRSRRTRSKAADNDDAEGDDDHEDDEDEDDDPPPRRKKSSKTPTTRKSSSKKKKPAPVEDEDEEEDVPFDESSRGEPDADEDEEEPEEKPKTRKTSKKKSTASKSSPKCPSGHRFGTDCDEYEECDSCELWDDCVKAQG